ncbi:hypothetical protein M3Y95_00951200 [Aphelenchoides besseyi]|nr:hypothetical protein M3Y95_00951200 [Aphelenchoides besseyi]
MPGPTELRRDEEKRMPVTEEASAQVFDEIESVYFNTDDFDATAHELSKMLGEELEIDEIERERFKLKKQLRVVSQKVSALITKNSAAFGKHVANYEIVRNETSELVDEIGAIRRILQKEQSTARNALSIVAADRQQWWLEKVKGALETLRTLHDTGYKLRDLMQRGEFPSAIQLCVEAKHAADLYSAFDSIRDMSDNLAKKLGSMEAHIDDALASSTVVFNYDRYSLVQTAYQMVGKTEEAAHKLQRFFHATVESSARRVLIELLGRTTETPDPESLSYEDLCKSVPDEHSLECVQEMGLVLCKVLCIYHTVLKFHIEDDERRLTALGVESVAMDGPQIVERGVFQISLIDGLHGIFQTAASKYNTLLGLQELSHMKFDSFIQIVEMTNRFRRFGRLHFNNSFADLSGTLTQQMNLYFAQYHRNRMEELRFHLENEAFALCPVPLQFTLFDLPEFLFLKESTDAFDDDDATTKMRNHREAVELNEKLNLIGSDTENPFLPSVKPNEEVKIVRNGKQSSLERASSEESCYMQDDPEMENSLPSVCNSALNLLKFFGRYIRMTSVLHSITEQVIHSIIQLFDFFFFVVYDYFARDSNLDQLELRLTSNRLFESINFIRKSLIQPEENGETVEDEVPFKYRSCTLASFIQLNDPENLFGLAERIVGVESVIFLGKQLELLRPVLESLLPAKKKSLELTNFYKNTLTASFDLREAVYGCVASRVLSFPQISKQVSQVNWNINELNSEHSKYIDSLCKEFAVINRRIDSIKEFAHVSTDIRNVIWTQIAYCLFKILVESYAEVSKKCSNEGRALMLLDFQQLNHDLEAISDLKPIPRKAYVEDYIKGYYQPDYFVDEWVRQHPDYSATQIAALVNHVKKSKSRILNILEGKEPSPSR